MHILKQYRIDSGKIGGLIAIFSSSLIILSPFSFIGILALNYDRYLKYWIGLNAFIIIFVILFVLYEWMFFVFVYPSMIQFGNRQSCIHDNPVYNEIIEMKKLIRRIEENYER